MHRAAADIYYQRGADALTGLAARWCRRHGRRFVFALAHDENCDPHMARLCGRVERRLYRYGLTRAHVILAQTRHQQALLRSGFDLPASVVPSCCTASPRCHGQSPGCHGQAQRRHADVGRVIDPTTAAPDSPIRCRILWVGRLSEEKRPEWILQLARDLPDLDFTAVGRCNAGSSYGRRLTEQLASCPNVTHHDHILHNRMPDLFRRADLLCCTSASEGFPNVFLEAWTSGTPVLSTVDPDGIIVTHRLGEVVGSLEQMTQRLRGVSADRQTWRDHGRAAQRYVRENHSVAATVDALLDALWPTAPTSRERNASGPAARPTAHRVYAP
ncbi:MAG: glycosyltransferase family 4 protein, partial [Phycisphaerae bacterium]